MTTDTKATVCTVGPRLSGKTSIITGAGSGMGYEAAVRFLEEDGNVVAVDLKDEGLKRLEAERGSEKLVTAVCDVTDRDRVAAVVGEAVDRFGALDCYFNNAGIP